MKTSTATTPGIIALNVDGTDVRLWKATPYKLLQNVVDEVFGKEKVNIPRAPMNHVTAPLRFVDNFPNYRTALKERLERLNEGLETPPSTPS